MCFKVDDKYIIVNNNIKFIYLQITLNMEQKI